MGHTGESALPLGEDLGDLAELDRQVIAAEVDDDVAGRRLRRDQLQVPRRVVDQIDQPVDVEIGAIGIGGRRIGDQRMTPIGNGMPWLDPDDDGTAL